MGWGRWEKPPPARPVIYLYIIGKRRPPVKRRPEVLRRNAVAFEMTRAAAPAA
jgi:hypothetical protein